MKILEILQALDDGKTLSYTDTAGTQVIHMGTEHLTESSGYRASIGHLLTNAPCVTVYEEPGNDFIWATKQLLSGKPVTRKSWPKESQGVCGVGVWVSIQDTLAKDWILKEDV